MNAIPEILFIFAFLAQDLPTINYYDRLAETHIYSENPLPFPVSPELQRGINRVAIRDKILPETHPISFYRYSQDGNNDIINNLRRWAGFPDVAPTTLLAQLPDDITCEINKKLAERWLEDFNDNYASKACPWNEDLVWEIRREAQEIVNVWTELTAIHRTAYFFPFDSRPLLLDFQHSMGYNLELLHNYPVIPYWRVELEH